jgi:glutamate synthase (NADPH) small chain
MSAPTSSAEQLLKEFDATVICTGRHQSTRSAHPRPRIEGHPLRHGLPHRQHERSSGPRPEIHHRKGKDVVIIGGGDTGTDCVGTSVRHGCTTVTQLEIMAKPPLTRAANNPWPEWPKTYKMDYGQEEAAAKFGDDPRVYLTTATHFEGDADGNVKAVHVVNVEWKKDDKGNFGPQKIPGTEKVLPAQLVLLAMGFLGPEQPLLDAFNIERDPAHKHQS